MGPLPHVALIEGPPARRPTLGHSIAPPPVPPTPFARKPLRPGSSQTSTSRLLLCRTVHPSAAVHAQHGHSKTSPKLVGGACHSLRGTCKFDGTRLSLLFAGRHRSLGFRQWTA